MVEHAKIAKMSNIPKIHDLRSLLEKHYDESVVVLSCDTKLLTAPGENYGGVILSVEASIKIGNQPHELKKFVAKLCPANQMLCDLFNIQETFKKEIGMYMDAIPALIDLEKEYGIKEDKIEDMFAKTLGARINLQPGSQVVDKDAVLLLENLKLSGYEMGDRLTGFDKDHAELIIKNLAKFHAVPVALKLIKPKIFEEKVLPCLKAVQLAEGFGPEAINSMVSEVTDVLKTNEKCVPYTEKISEFMHYHMDGPYRTNSRDSKFSSIVHSDYWMNNTMVLQDEDGKPIHNKIVDLQLTMFNSVIHDLLFFLYSSIKSEIIYPNVDHFIKLYYDNFIDRLKQFDVDVSAFTWDEFTKELTEIAPLEIGHILMMYKPILTVRGAINDMSDFDDNEMFRRDNVSPDYSKRILDTTLSFIQRKWLLL